MVKKNTFLSDKRSLPRFRVGGSFAYMQPPNTASLSKTTKRDLYFTNDYEWIDFQGSVAFTGICPFKLKGIKSIEKIDFVETKGLFKPDEVIGSLYYAEYKIDIHIPVAGRILSFNDELAKGDRNLILTQPENEGWFALIVPSTPYDRTGLLTSEKNQLTTKSGRQET